MAVCVNNRASVLHEGTEPSSPPYCLSEQSMWAENHDTTLSLTFSEHVVFDGEFDG